MIYPNIIYPIYGNLPKSMIPHKSESCQTVFSLDDLGSCTRVLKEFIRPFIMNFDGDTSMGWCVLGDHYDRQLTST
jgi:hypothetical protein